MTPPVSTSGHLNQLGLGQDVLCRAVSGSVIGALAERPPQAVTPALTGI